MRRNKWQREKDLMNLAERYLRGEYQADIAASMGVQQSTISKDLRELQRRWQAASVTAMDAMKAEQLAKIDELERTYWEAWARSKEDAEITVTKTRGLKIKKTDTVPVTGGELLTATNHTEVTGAPFETMHRTEGQVGNPAFLAGVQWCINKRCELFGLDAPRKVEWRQEAAAKGLDPSAIFNELVKNYVAALPRGQ